jgi:MPBQ/MSBQ methyltransferase
VAHFIENRGWRFRAHSSRRQVAEHSWPRLHGTPLKSHIDRVYSSLGDLPFQLALLDNLESKMNNPTATLNRFYEEIARGDTRLVFDKIGFLNIGYWKGVEDSVELAQLNLIETLAGFFTRSEGNILDVACGNGVSTKFLTKYFDANHITGINISEMQLQICKRVAPQCNFRLMDATKLEFSDLSFDNVLCIEAAQHFKTRHRFLEEAYRVLTPGGRLAMHDLVLHDPNRLDAPDAEIWPEENYMPNLETYRDNLSQIGFKHVRVEDITEFSMTAVMKCLVRKLEREFDRKRDYKVLEDAMSVLNGNSPWMPGKCSWCMAYAIK